MGIIEIMFLLFGLFFVFKAFTAKNWHGVSDHRRRLTPLERTPESSTA